MRAAGKQSAEKNRENERKRERGVASVGNEERASGEE